MQNTQVKCAVLLIATRKYKTFVQPLIEGLDKNFLPGHQVNVHLFVDEYFAKSLAGKRVTVSEHLIPPYVFPEATLLRYKVFHEHKEWLQGYDQIFYLDVDMAVVDTVGDEMLSPGLTVVRHPGFYANKGWGSGGNDPRSNSYLEPEYCNKYYCGGVNGGAADKFLTMCELLHKDIQDDISRGVQAIYHDETHMNAFLNKRVQEEFPDWWINELTPSYCTVPSMEQRKAWGIDHLPAKIIALDKVHAEIRS